MKMTPIHPEGHPEHDRSDVQGPCERCGTILYRFRGQGDFSCHKCDANYNCFGQRLRDDLRTRVNYSEYDDDIDDLTGDEESWVRLEQAAELATEQYFDNRR
jgi:hypothetical protein